MPTRCSMPLPTHMPKANMIGKTSNGECSGVTNRLSDDSFAVKCGTWWYRPCLGSRNRKKVQKNDERPKDILRNASIFRVNLVRFGILPLHLFSKPSTRLAESRYEYPLRGS